MARKTQLQTLREIERQLDAELHKLRSTIRAAERGENARIKDVSKYVAKRSRELATVAKAQEKIQAEELERLEKFLGDTFESLSEARSALQKQTRKATKKEIKQEIQRLQEKVHLGGLKPKTAKRIEQQAVRLQREIGEVSKSKLNPKKPSYEVRELSAKENQSVIDFLTDKPTFDRLGDGYLNPGEYVSVSVPYHYHDANGHIRTGHAAGKKLFSSWSALREYIMHYGDGTAEENLDTWLGSIEVIKFPSQLEGKITRARFIDKRDATRKETKAYWKAKHKRETEQAIQTKTSKQNKQIEQLKRENARLRENMKRILTPYKFNQWRRKQDAAMRDEIRHIKSA